MKKALFMLLFFSGLVACDNNKKEEPKEEPKFDPYVMLAINGSVGTKTSADTLALREVVKYTIGMDCNSGSYTIAAYKGANDTLNCKLKLWGWGVVDTTMQGEIVPGFLVTDTEDAVLFRRYDDKNQRWTRFDSIEVSQWFSNTFDTIAYIPNATILRARDLVMKAFETKDYDRCYKILDSAYTFVPITGAEWRALKAKGEQ